MPNNTLEDKAKRALELGASPEDITRLLHSPEQLNRVSGVLPVSGAALAGGEPQQEFTPPVGPVGAAEGVIPAYSPPPPSPRVSAELQAFESYVPEVRFPPLYSQEIQAPEEPGLVEAEWGRGWANLKADWARTGALLAGQFPGELPQQLAEDWTHFAEEQDAYARELPNYVKNVEDLQSMGDYGNFIAGSLVRNAPMLASLFLPGAAGRAIGVKIATKLGAGTKAAQKAGLLTGLGTAGATDYGQLTGETAGGIAEAGAKPQEHFGRIATTGAFKTLLDFMPWFALARRLGIGRIVDEEALKVAMSKGFIKRAGNNMATLLATEVPTETAQEMLDIIAESSVKAADEQGLLTPENKSRLLNAAAGAATFSLLGLPAAVIRPQQKVQEGPPSEPGAPLPQLSGKSLEDFKGENFIGPIRPRGFDWKDFQLGDSIFDYFDEEAPTPMPIIGESTVGPTQLQKKKTPRVAITFQDEKNAQRVANYLAVYRDGKIQTLSQEDLQDREAGIIEATVDPVNRTPAQDFIVFQARKRRIQAGRERLKGLYIPAERKAEPRVQKIESLVQRLIGDEKNYRKKDGQLKVAIQKKIDRLTKQIESLRGVPTGVEAAQAESTARPAVLTGEFITRGRAAIDDLGDAGYSVEEDNGWSLYDEYGEQVFEADIKGLPQEVQRNWRIVQSIPAGDAAIIDQTVEGPPAIESTARPAVLTLSKKGKKAFAKRQARTLPEKRQARTLPENKVPVPTGPEIPNLSEKESLLYNRLIEQEQFDGLNEKQYATLEKLMSKALGETPAPRTAAGTVDNLINAIETTQEAAKVTRAQKGLGKGMSKDAVRQAISSLEKIFGIEANVVTIDDFPKESPLRGELFFANALYSEYADGTKVIFINADNANSARDVQKTYLHEVVGHFGIRRVYSLNELKALQKAGGYKTLEELEEQIAEAAENPHKNPTFLSKAIAFFHRALRRLGIKLKLSNSEIREMLADSRQYLLGLSTTRNRPQEITSTLPAESPTTTLFKKAGAEVGDIEDEVTKWDSLWGIRVGKWVMTPIQMEKVFGRFAPEAKKYLNRVAEWWNTKVGLMAQANPLAERWNRLNEVEGKRLGEALYESVVESEENGAKLTPDQTERLLARLKLDDETKALYYDIVKSFEETLARLEAGLKYNAVREYLEDGNAARAFLDEWESAKTGEEQLDVLQKYSLEGEALEGSTLSGTLQTIDKDMKRMRERNYFPHMRFGPYAVVVRATKDGVKFEGKEYKKGKIMYFATYESTTAQKEAAEDLKKTLPKDSDLKAPVMKETEFSFIGMPPGLMDSIKDQLDLTPEQILDLKDIFNRVSPGRAFLRHMIRRRNIAGFSQDAQRVYATYMLNAANHIARVEHYRDMTQQLEDLEMRQKGYDPEATREAKRKDPKAGAVFAEGVDVRKVGILANYFRKHYKYIMNPGNDLAKLRAMGFMWYLGFNAKSAVVNLSQVPLVTYPYLGERYGDLRALKAIKDAYPAAAKFVSGKEKHGLSDNEVEVIQKLTDDGMLDESIATELAGFSESTVLERLIPRTAIGRFYNKLSYASAWMFRHAEKYNRHVTAIAAARLAFNEGANLDKAYIAAKDAIQSTQFEYAKWNRPEFQRGKKSVFFLFWQYMQHASFLAFGGHGKGTATRFWMMLLLAAGFQGLPFAENLLDIIDWSSTQMKKLLGSEDPHTDTRVALREFLNSMTNSAEATDGMMHGMSRYFGMGPIHMLDLMGVPVPNVDVSGSLSLGRVVPGLSDLLGATKSPEEKFGRTMVEVLGPVMGVPYALWRSANDTNPDSWKKWERAMPTVVKSASRALRISSRGGEEYRGGGELIDYDPQDIDHRLEQYAQSVGFAPTRLTQAYELTAAQNQSRQWYGARRSLLLEDYVYARMHRKRELQADVRKAIRMYNHSVPDARLKITPQTLARSWKERNRLARLRTEKVPSARGYRGVYRHLEETFPGER